MMDAAISLAYAIYDAENTTRLSEASDGVQEEYFKRAKDILAMIAEYRPAAEKAAIARAICPTARSHALEEAAKVAEDMAASAAAIADRHDASTDEFRTASTIAITRRPCMLPD